MHAAVEDGDWVDVARETIQARIATYPPGSVSSSSLCLIWGVPASAPVLVLVLVPYIRQ